MATAYLSMGCNKGNCRENLADAIIELNKIQGVEVTKVSSLYVTEPVGKPDQPDFLNLAAELITGLPPLQLLSACQHIENGLGARIDRIHWGPRTIDIDILLFGQEIIADYMLRIPHPHLLDRAFVLVPLAEIASEVIIPNNGTVAEARNRLGGRHRVEKREKLHLL